MAKTRAQKHEREAILALARVGIVGKLALSDGNTHKTIFLVKDGVEAKIFVSCSPAADDKQTCRHVVQNARKALRAKGVAI
jgi:hypothetical protein